MSPKNRNHDKSCPEASSRFITDNSFHIALIWHFVIIGRISPHERKPYIGQYIIVVRNGKINVLGLEIGKVTTAKTGRLPESTSTMSFNEHHIKCNDILVSWVQWNGYNVRKCQILKLSLYLQAEDCYIKHANSGWWNWNAEEKQLIFWKVIKVRV
jgi:hypothetical protein